MPRFQLQLGVATFCKFIHTSRTSLPLQVADEYGSEAYRGAIDLTLHDPTGKDIHHASNIQDDEIEVQANGVKVRRNCSLVHASFFVQNPCNIMHT